MLKYCKSNLAYAAVLATAAMLGSVAAVESAHAQSPRDAVSLSSEAQIERVITSPDGSERTVLKKPSEVVVVPGDKVIFTLKYANKGAVAAAGFRATNPMPGPVQFLAAAEDWAEVSVDGGANWGKLSALNVRLKGSAGQPDLTRAATAEDVTHVRWVFANPIPAGTSGSVSYRGLIK